jgi:hypothetical protein
MDRNLEREREEAEEHKSRIESARDSLYQPGGPSVIHREDDYHRRQDDDEALPSQQFAPPPVAHSFDKEKLASKTNTIFRRLLIAAVLFFIVSLGVAAFLYFYGNTTISAKNIKIDVNAPPTVPSSDTFSFDVSVQNGNNSDLINSTLVIDYPEGTRVVDDNTKPLVSERIDLGTLSKGEIAKKTVSARLFGEENAEKKIGVRLEYEVEGSNAHFTKEDEFNVILRLAPIVLSIEALKEVNSNQEVTLVAKVISNSNNMLSNVALNVIYPFGFTYTSSNLEVDGKTGEFPLGNLAPNESKTVEIKGIINGQSAEDKVFKFNVGTASAENDTRVTTSLAQYVHDMTIRGDFLASSIVFDERGGYATLGAPIRGYIQWKNTLPDSINDAEFTLRIDGDLINLDSVAATRGFYDSNEGVIEWNKNTDDDLEEIMPGESGNFGFTISMLPKEDALAQRITNPKVHLSFDVHGRRLTDNDVPEDIESSFVRTVPVVTAATLQGKSLYNSGPMKNTGPLPPKAENKTTYTVALSLSNTVNAITAGEVTANLPNYVTYEGEVSPSSDKVSWNENTRQLRWSPGTVPARTGYGSAPRTFYFKVSITPSRTQVGQVLPLVNNIALNGRDEFANVDIKANSTTVTTSIQDPGTGYGNGQVVQ